MSKQILIAYNSISNRLLSCIMCFVLHSKEKEGSLVKIKKQKKKKGI